MATELYSFGFRHGLTIDGQLVFAQNASKQRDQYQTVGNVLVVDVRRCLPKNPYHDKKLRALRGDDDAVIKELESTPGLHQAYYRIRERVDQHSGPVYIACTGGHHRSVYVANRLSKDLHLSVLHLNYDDH